MSKVYKRVGNQNNGISERERETEREREREREKTLSQKILDLMKFIILTTMSCILTMNHPQ